MPPPHNFWNLNGFSPAISYTPILNYFYKKNSYLFATTWDIGYIGAHRFSGYNSQQPSVQKYTVTNRRDFPKVYA